jgi:uncharacterized protein involved in tellurium resistance
MTKQELIEALKKCAAMSDNENAHIQADQLLLDFIGDDEIRQAFNSILRWHA